MTTLGGEPYLNLAESKAWKRNGNPSRRGGIQLSSRDNEAMICTPQSATPARTARTASPFSILEAMRKLDRSRQLQQRAEQLLPGGVDSPVRAFRAVGGDPPFVVRAEGAYLWDADGNRYIDYFGSWGPMILGHAFPPVVEAIQQAAARSASFGASTAIRGRPGGAHHAGGAVDREAALRLLGH